MLTDAQKEIIRSALKREKRTESFLEDAEAILCEYQKHRQFFIKIRQERGHAGVGRFKTTLRKRLAYRVAQHFGYNGLPRPSDDTMYNTVMGVMYEAAGCPVNGKARRDTLRSALQGSPEFDIPPLTHPRFYSLQKKTD